MDRVIGTLKGLGGDRAAGHRSDSTSLIRASAAVLLLAGLLLAGAMFIALAVMPSRVQAAGQENEDSLPRLDGSIAKFRLFNRPQALPGLNISDEAGNAVDIKAFRGRVVLLNLWATWCKPCIEEMPSLDALQARAGGAEFEVLPLSLDRNAGVVQQFLRKHDLQHLQVYLDPKGHAVGDLNLKGLPTSFLIDHQGRAVGEFVGDTDWNTPEVIKLIGYYVRAARRDNRS